MQTREWADERQSCAPTPFKGFQVSIIDELWELKASPSGHITHQEITPVLMPETRAEINRLGSTPDSLLAFLHSILPSCLPPSLPVSLPSFFSPYYPLLSLHFFNLAMTERNILKPNHSWKDKKWRIHWLFSIDPYITCNLSTNDRMWNV